MKLARKLEIVFALLMALILVWVVPSNAQDSTSTAGFYPSALASFTQVDLTGETTLFTAPASFGVCYATGSGLNLGLSLAPLLVFPDEGDAYFNLSAVLFTEFYGGLSFGFGYQFLDGGGEGLVNPDENTLFFALAFDILRL